MIQNSTTLNLIRLDTIVYIWDSGVTLPLRLPVKISSWVLFFPQKVGEGRKTIFRTIFIKKWFNRNFRTMTSKSMSQKCFPIHVYTKNRGPNFTIWPIPAFGGQPLQIFWPSITEARAKFYSHFCWGLPGVEVPRLWTPASYATELRSFNNSEDVARFNETSLNFIK
jgi:hypothetical protein